MTASTRPESAAHPMSATKSAPNTATMTSMPSSSNAPMMRRSVDRVLNPEDLLELELAPGLQGAARHGEPGHVHRLQQVHRDRPDDRDELQNDVAHHEDEEREDPHERRLLDERPAARDPAQRLAEGDAASRQHELEPGIERRGLGCGGCVHGAEKTPRWRRQQARGKAAT